MRLLTFPSLVYFLGLCFVCTPVQAQSDSLRTSISVYFADTTVLSFADFLWQLREYRRAIDEYQRYLFSDTAVHRSYATYQIGRGYLRIGEPFQAAPYFTQAARLAAQPTFRDSSHVAYAATLLMGNSDKAFHETVDTLTLAPSSQALQQRLLEMQVLYSLKQQQWRNAMTLLADTLGLGAPVSGLAARTELLGLAMRGQHLPHKSPWVAATLSTFVPGAGKFYAGRISDGLYSLILIAGNAWLSYEGFRDKGIDSFKGWLFGTAGTIFYLGNIYGSVVAVRLYNQSAADALRHDIQAQISISTYF